MKSGPPSSSAARCASGASPITVRALALSAGLTSFSSATASTGSWLTCNSPVDAVDQCGRLRVVNKRLCQLEGNVPRSRRAAGQQVERLDALRFAGRRDIMTEEMLRLIVVARSIEQKGGAVRRLLVRPGKAPSR